MARERSYTCYTCGAKILRTNSHRFQGIRYCNDCWELYQQAWGYNIESWIASQGENIRPIDQYPRLKGKGYYVLSNGDIYSTRFIYKSKNDETFSTFYLPRPIKYEVKDTPQFIYGQERYKLYIKDIVYTAFKGPIDSKKYIIVNKDFDIFNNDISNLMKIPRNLYMSNHIYYAVKNGVKIAESNSVEGLAKILGMYPQVIRRLIRSGKKTKHGIYLKKR